MFGKKVDPKEKAKEWKRAVKTQSREMDKQMRHITREEEKMKAKVKLLMKQGHTDAVEPLVKELVMSKKTKSKILKTRTQLDSIIRQIDLQIAQIKVCGAFQQSTEVTHMLNSLVKLPEINATMMKLQQEMQAAGMAGEMIDESMEAIEDDVEDPELAVRLVFNEIAKEVNATAGKTKIEYQPIEPEELEDNPEIAAQFAH